MFEYCSSLRELNISNFDISQVTSLNFMFEKCKSLKNLNISNIVFKDNIDINNMFALCSDELKNKIRKQNKGIKENAFEDFEIHQKSVEPHSEHEHLDSPFESEEFLKSFNNEQEEPF